MHHVNIRIVLTHTSHPGNIGACARAMKTMGLTDLYLVSPKTYPSVQAIEMASGADDVLENAVVTESLDEALADCHYVVGTSARTREIPLALINPREAGERVVAEAQSGQVAILFGREHAGLTNDELLRCQSHVCIPSNPEYSSLNLAAAVQVLCYEVCMASQSGKVNTENLYDELASMAEIEGFYQHLESTLYDTGFLTPDQPKRVIPKLRRLFSRTRLEKMEIKILRGILSAFQNK